MTEHNAVNRKYLQVLEKEYEAYQKSPKFSLNSEELFCVCRKPDHGELMVACDGCDEWYHFKCVGIEKKYKDLVNNYYCQFCDLLLHRGKSVWKRKCKLDSCYKPIAGQSQFCSAEHGKIYWNIILHKFEETNHSSEVDIAEVVNRQQVENLLQHVQSRNQLNEIGNELPLFDKEQLKVTGSQFSELNANKEKLRMLEENINILRSKYQYLMKLQNVITQVSDILTTSLDPNSIQYNAENPDGNTAIKQHRKSKPRKFKVDICGFDENLLLNDSQWPEFCGTEHYNLISNFTVCSELDRELIVQYYKSPEPFDDESSGTFMSLLRKLCLLDKGKKCHLHGGWFTIYKYGIDLKLKEKEQEKNEIIELNEKLIKMIQIKNWRLYCDDL